MTGVTRRGFCGALAGGLSAGATGWEERLGVLCQLGAEEAGARKVIEAARAAGYRRVMVNFAWDKVDAAFLRGLPGWLSGAGLKCEALGAYVNCAVPAAVLMSTREQDFDRAIEYAGELKCGRLVAWTGSHVADLMKADARNSEAASEDALVRFVEARAKRLEARRLRLALETYITLVCPDARSLKRVLGRLPDFVGAVMDPPNLTPLARYAERDQALREMMAELKGRIEVVHLKDFRLAAGGKGYELPGPLAGEMNYRLYASEIAKLAAGVPVAAEHIGPSDFARVRGELLKVL